MEALRAEAQRRQSALNETSGAAPFVQVATSGCIHALLVGNN